MNFRQRHKHNPEFPGLCGSTIQIISAVTQESLKPGNSMIASVFSVPLAQIQPHASLQIVDQHVFCNGNSPLGVYKLLSVYNKQFPAFPQNSSITSLNFWGISIFTQCPAFSKISTFNSGSLLFQSCIIFSSIGISNFPHPINKSYFLDFV